ncbi:MAG: O-antigen ligase family protein [Deltaproteobacteria bacterium]|nr:O-antigen ligase family protein [Deltaproteobacteria bacterium]
MKSDSRLTNRIPDILSRRLLALSLAATIVWVIFFYPLGKVWLSSGLLLYAIILRRYPSIWLFFIPALLPVLDLAPWTGWFFLDEFDLFVLVTFAVCLWKKHEKSQTLTLPNGMKWIIGLFALFYTVSGLIGLLPVQAYDANAFSTYWSNYNSLRVAKGFFWAVVFIPLLQKELLNDSNIRKYFIPGMLTGLAGVVMVAIWERQVFSGLFNFSSDFRITSTFSAMHTGGAYIDGYLAMALPFVASSFIFWRNKLAYLGGILLFGGGLYTLLVTFSRIDYLAFAFSFFILLCGLVYKYKRKKQLFIVVLLVAALVILVALPVLQGPFIQKRFAGTAHDIKVRFEHWGNAIEMMDSDWLTMLFGMGLGSYPRTYFQRNPKGIRPAFYSYVKEGDNTYLRLEGGDALYMGQRVRLSPDSQYTLKFDARSSDSRALLTIPICEKSLLYSFRCKWLSKKVGNTKGQWISNKLSFSSESIGSGNFYQKRPVELAMFNSQRNTVVEVDNVQLVEEQGNNLIRNGDFSHGCDHWFFTIDNLLLWQTQNLWVLLVFEQGWVSLLLFNVLLLYTLTKLAMSFKEGNLLSLVLLSSLIGFLTVGLIGSLFDSPRIAMLFYLVIFISIFHSARLAMAGSAEVRG